MSNLDILISATLFGAPIVFCVSAAISFSGFVVLNTYYDDRRSWLNKYKLAKAKHHQLQSVDPIGTESLTSKLYCEALLITQPEVPGWAFWITEYRDNA